MGGDRNEWGRTDQPAPRAVDRHRPPGADAPNRRRCALVQGGAAQGGDHEDLADAEAGQTRRFDAAGRIRQAPAMDRGRPVARRRGQLDAQRLAVHLRTRRRRRGAGPLGCRAAGDRTPEPERVDDPGRRRCPVDVAGRAGAVVGRLRAPVADRIDRNDRRPDDRLPGPRADPARRQPSAAADRGRRDREPQRPLDWGGSELGHRHGRRSRAPRRHRRPQR